MLLDQRFGRLCFSKKKYNLKCNVTFCCWFICSTERWFLSEPTWTESMFSIPLVWIVLLIPYCWISFMIPLALSLVPIPPISKPVSLPPWLKLVFWMVRLKLVLRTISTDYHNDHITSLYSNTRRYRRYKQPSG